MIITTIMITNTKLQKLTVGRKIGRAWPAVSLCLAAGLCPALCLYIYIYIYIDIEREREIYIR